MRRPIGTTWGLLLVAIACAPAPLRAEEPASSRYARRWFYAAHNLQVKENADRLIDLIARAKKAGYNGVVLADYKLSILDRVPDFYFANADRVRKAAEREGVEIVPTVFPIGYSSGLLAHDPNLAEGLPVRDAPFVVQGTEAVLDADACGKLVNGDLEQHQGDTFAGFSFQDTPGQSTFADRGVAHGGTASCRLDAAGPDPNRRLVQRVKLRPYTAYRFSAWVQTASLTNVGGFRLLALGASEGGRTLTFYEGQLQPTQGWKRVEVVFNSLDQADVNLYAGLWGGGKGMVWVDDLNLEPLGLVNVLRRPGCPLKVAAEDGTVYEEGRDFEPVVDARLGQIPYAGEYDFDHPPARLRLKPGSRIRDGQRLRVSWFHPVLVHGSQVMCCPSEPKVYDLLADQARRVRDLFHPRAYFMSHDEIRVLNWDDACRQRGLTPGRILADNVQRCAEILKSVSPRAEIVVWSDMFDPHHNAVDGYYLVDGTLAGSWEGLPPEVVIANWNGPKMRPSLEFFAGRGHRQILAGYYDADDLSGFTGWDQAARGVPRVEGFLYTTWQPKYGLLEAYGRAMQSPR
jgi:hypothetical protein